MYPYGKRRCISWRLRCRQGCDALCAIARYTKRGGDANAWQPSSERPAAQEEELLLLLVRMLLVRGRLRHEHVGVLLLLLRRRCRGRGCSANGSIIGRSLLRQSLGLRGVGCGVGAAGAEMAAEVSAAAEDRRVGPICWQKFSTVNALMYLH